MDFYVGLHQPSDAPRFARSFISVNRLRGREKCLAAQSWIMDSGAFSELSIHGRYRHSVVEYAKEIGRWTYDLGLRAVVAQDYMCEPWILARTGLSVRDHQRLTVERYDELKPLVDVYVMPVLQGYARADYVRHLEAYGERLRAGAWVGVGSICKRNTDPWEIEQILAGVKRRRPDLRLHGFGLKTTALRARGVRDLLHSADSMAWSFAARREGRDANDWREAKAFEERIAAAP